MNPLLNARIIIGGAILLGLFTLPACGETSGDHPGVKLLTYTRGVLCDRPCAADLSNMDARLRPNEELPARTIEVKSKAIAAAPWQVFAALTNPEIFSEFSGAPATAASRRGSVFLTEYALFGGILTALTFYVDARPDRIDLYQLWNGSAPLPEGHPHAGKLSMPQNYFTVTKFSISETAAGVVLTVTQHGVPEHSASFVAAGWEKFYLTPIKAFLERG